MKTIDPQNSNTSNGNEALSSSRAPEPIHYTTQQQYQKQYEQNNNNVDVYSIRQFGFNVPPNNTNYDPIQRPDPNPLTNNSFLQPQYPYNNLSQNVLTNTTTNQNNSRGLNYNQEPVLKPSSIPQHNSIPVSSSNSSVGLFGFSEFSPSFIYGTPNSHSSSPLDTANTNRYNNYNNIDGAGDPSALFRHRPDNPFWGMPSSMELDDWHAYLLPHQKQHQ